MWSTIVKDPIFQEQKRRSTDLRDRFRNAFPHLYQAAGYKPRSIPKKRRGDMSAPPLPRVAADDQCLPIRTSNTTRRRRSRTNPGYSYSVPQSATNSDDEDSSDDDDEYFEIQKSSTKAKEATPQPEEATLPQTVLDEVTMHTIDQADPLGEFIPEMSQVAYESADQSTWSSDHSPAQIDSWSSAATTTTTSPTSSHVSINDYFMRDSFDTLTRRDGLNMIGKSAWGQSDWMSANPRLDASGTSTSSSSSLFGGPSPPPSSPFSFSQLTHHGIMDRYDLFQNSLAHDFASEVGAGDSHSTFSDPDMFPSQSMRGFTHHSNYAGDLIFGARTHQPQMSMNSFGDLALGLSGLGQLNLAHDSGGLNLSGMSQAGPSTSINPMHLHTPSLAGIDELELMAISLDDFDDEPMMTSSTTNSTNTAEVGVQKDDSETALLDAVDLSSLIHLPPQTLEEIAGLTAESSVQMESEAAATPPATPLHSGRTARELHTSGNQYSSFHSRSMSVPPFERERATQRPIPQGLATPQPGPTRSLSLFDMPTTQAETEQTPMTMNSAQASLFSLSSTMTGDQLKAIGADLSDLVFLDLQHRFESVMPTHDLMDPLAEETRKGLALDLARTPVHPVHPGHSANFVFSSNAPLTPSAGAKPFTHHRGQSAISPKDLQLQSGSDNKRKRASWDGGPSEVEFVCLT